ncbi:tetratricopeptide repeat protein [Oceanobacillus kapialis]|uniref:Tetratricopeptide repeat protein n=1 Tax=Oceanobacillus kapialis TaxID=481353 RepID=A0ABW5Q3J2_9BACI
MEGKLNKAIELRKGKQYKESNAILLELVVKYPDNPFVNYQCAWSFDLLGEEAEAVPFYEKAIELGLPEKELEGAIIGLGSTYRALGNYEKSESTFLKGLQRFPENRALQTFYSMTLYNLKQHSRAMELLLQCLVETTTDKNIVSYERAINFYLDKLDETW